MLRGEAEIHIDAPPERVWAIVTDITRMGELSPVTFRCEWLGGSTGPSVGARFRGHNKMFPIRWSTICEVTASEPGKLFEFRVIDGTFNFGARGRETTRWRYTFEPDGIGTRIHESYEVAFTPAALRVPENIVRKIPGGARMADNRRAQTDRGMEETLKRLKRVAEGE